MKLSCTQENLDRGLTLVSRVASRNAALPILNNVLLTADQQGITLQTTNLELGIAVLVRGKVEEPGTYTVQSRLLAEFIHLLQHEKVSLETVDGGLKIISGHSSTTIKGLPAEEFPIMPTNQDGGSTSLPSNLFRRCLEGVVYAAANDESRPEISGVYLQLHESQLVLAATDSYRLGERRCATLQAVQANRNAILPSRTAQELLRVLPDDETAVSLTISDNQAQVKFEEVAIITRLIDGRYPDYQQIIPQQWLTKATVNREQFLVNIRAASLFCKPGINDLSIELNPAKSSVFLRAASTQSGEHQAEVPIVGEGKAVTTIFNYRYLLEGIQSLSGEEMIVECGDPQAPGVLRSAKSPDELCLVMPIRQ